MKIRFLNDVDALVIGTAATFGAMEEERYDRGQVVEVRSVKPQAPPSSDMADVVLTDGRKLALVREDFEIA